MNGSPTTGSETDADFSIWRSTSGTTTSTVAESSFGLGSGSTSGREEVTVAVLVTASPGVTGVTSMSTYWPDAGATSPSAQVTVWPSTSHDSPVHQMTADSIWKLSGTTSVSTMSRAIAGPLLEL